MADETLSGEPRVITLSGLRGGPGGGFSGATAQQPGGGFSGGKFMPGQQGGMSLDQLIQFLQLSQQGSGGGDIGAANSAGLLQSLGVGGLGPQSFGQGGQQGGQSFVAGQMTAPGAPAGGQSVGTGSIDPASVIAKVFGIATKASGLSSPTQADLGTQADVAGSDPAAFAAQRAGERTASPTFDLASASPFQIPSGILTGQSGGSIAGSNIGDFTQLTPTQVQDLLLQQEGAGLYTGAGPGAGVGATNTLSQGAGGGGAAPGQGSSLSGSNLGQGLGQAAGGLGVGAGLFGLIQALRSGNTAGFGPGVGQTLQGLVQLLRNSPDLVNSLPEGIRGLFGAPPSSTVGSGIGGVGSALSLIGGLTGSKGLGELGADIGGIGSLATTVGPMVSALQAGDTAAFEAATAALSAAAPAAVVAAAIQMAVTLASDISAGASPLQTTFDTLAAPDVIASAIARNVVDPAFQPSAAWRSFPERVEQTAGLEEQGLRALMEGLPYIRSKQELGQELGAFKNLIGTQVGGYGQGSGEFTLPNLPEVGTRTHGVPTPPTPADFGQVQQNTQKIIDLLSQRLPDTGQPFDLMRDLYQFLPRQQFAPIQTGAPIPSPTGGNEGFVNQLFYGSPGYDYAASGFPDPGKFFGSVNPLWAALGLPSFTPGYTGPQASGGPAVSSPLPTGQTQLPAPDSSVGAAYAQFLSQGYTPDQAWTYAQAIQPQQGVSP